MTDKNIIDDIQRYDTNFQIKCISCILSDQSFIERIYDILDVNFFENDAQRWIVSTTVEYFLQYKTLPTLDVFKIKIDSIDNEVLRTATISNLKAVYMKMNSSDISFIKNVFLEFCKNQKMKQAIVASVDLLERGDYNTIYEMMGNALKAGMERNNGHEYLVDIEKRMSQMCRKTISTGWQIIDSAMDGGLAGGELGVITACAGSGKSWILTRIGAEAIMAGYKVLHITLELNENYVGLRYDSCITGVDFQNIRTNVELIKQKIAEIPGKLFIKYFPIKTISAMDIKMHVEKLKMVGFSPDILIVDYADILRSFQSTRNSNSYSEAGGIYEELRSIAGELQLPIWTASQSNRGAMQEDIIQADNISDSYRKIMTADFVISLSRKTEDKLCNTARLHVIKNRFGPDGMTYPAKMNAGCGKVDIFDSNSPEGISLLTGMKNTESTFRKNIKERLDSFRNDEE